MCDMCCDNNENMGWIYIFCNLINGKKYVGQTIQNVNRRIKRHISNSKDEKRCKYLINKAIKKYGIENFKIIKYQCEDNELDFHEQFLIKELNALVPNGYNLESGGHINKHHHQETAKKLSIINKGRFVEANNPRSLDPRKMKQLILEKHPNAQIGDYFYRNHILYFHILDCEKGHNFELRIHDFKYNNRWCKQCYLENNKGENSPSSQNIEEVKKKIFNIHPDCKINHYYFDSKNRGGLFLNITCKNNHTFDLRMGNFNHKNTWCMKCRSENNKGKNNPNALNPEEIKKQIQEKHPNAQIGDYFYKKGRLRFNILNCSDGHHFELSINSFLNQKSWCKQCSVEYNKGENHPSAKIYKFISPDNKIFIIKGVLINFCKKNNLSYGMIHRYLTKEYKKNNYKGWKIEYSTDEEYARFKNNAKC